MTDDTPWRYGQVFGANEDGPVELYGYTHRGLALVNHGWANPRSKTRWDLIHLGSGSAVVRFVGAVASVMPVANEIAECGDWTLFDMPDGWKQTDPDLMEKLDAICAAHPEVEPETWDGPEITDEQARAVIEARDAACSSP